MQVKLFCLFPILKEKQQNNKKSKKKTLTESAINVKINLSLS